ncbi:response regulator transcription factor [Anaerococcus tetradius]|jgi:hypothetical protein|uniref:Response regulator receiver domain protein n=2 Tax=Anaerococcus tetradius TaxID=33036 RepID=C2CJA6_9FIRM|nr:response regulator transcription factor [Anaerococcus tetradius]EEI82371.1 response regulator receiver domain protein [Anaerococcus tetradius ATCC 35098]KWZ78407.1 putative transcriptional activator protein Irlr [Anaerococcus tetradius]
MKVLIVEDEKKLLRLLEEGLNILGYVTDTASDGEEALDLAYVENYDIIILDINLPKKDGFEVLRDIRQFNREVNIIMLTARSDIDDRVRGLDYGANDYMTKPFDLKELDARMRSLLRRKSIMEETEIMINDLSFDTVKREVVYDGRILALTAKETGIIEYLFLNRQRYVTVEEIMEHVWDSNADDFSNTVRVHMSSLRKKIKKATGKNYIENVIGKGYKIYEN